MWIFSITLGRSFVVHFVIIQHETEKVFAEGHQLLFTHCYRSHLQFSSDSHPPGQPDIIATTRPTAQRTVLAYPPFTNERLVKYCG
jgi:hypothetical protein